MIFNLLLHWSIIFKSESHLVPVTEILQLGPEQITERTLFFWITLNTNYKIVKDDKVSDFLQYLVGNESSFCKTSMELGFYGIYPMHFII